MALDGVLGLAFSRLLGLRRLGELVAQRLELLSSLLVLELEVVLGRLLASADRRFDHFLLSHGRSILLGLGTLLDLFRRYGLFCGLRGLDVVRLDLFCRLHGDLHVLLLTREHR